MERKPEGFLPKPKPIEDTEDETISSIFTRFYVPPGGAHNRKDPIYLDALHMAGGDQEKGLKVYQELCRTIDALHAIDWRTPDIDQASQVMRAVVDMARTRIELHLESNHSTGNEE